MGAAVMSMREARIADHWRRALTRVYPTRLDAITFEGLSCLANDTVTFSPGITAVVGGNGVGKSTLIAAVAELLSNGAIGHSIDRSNQVFGSNIQAQAFVTNNERALAIHTDAAGSRVTSDVKFEGEYRWLDPSAFAQLCVIQIRNDTNFEDLLDPVAPIELDKDSLDLVSYLIGKNYTSCAIYEIADYGNLERFPYFRVTSSGVTYGSESMGRGELSLFLSYWVLQDLPKCSILVLEEPETHVSPRSQDHLMNTVAKFCDEHAIWVIATTHSPAIIRRLPPSHIRLVARGTGLATILHTPSSVQVATILSGGVAFKGIFLVEDEGAKSFLLAIIEELASDLLPQFEIVPAGSDSEITKVMQSFPMTKDWLTVIGVYDGGIQPTIDTAKFIWPVVFLPGQQAPELVLRDLAIGSGPIQSDFCTHLHLMIDDVVLALNHIAGVDHHEWIRDFAKAIARDVSVVRQTLIHLWIGRNRNNAEEFIKQLRSVILSITRDPSAER
jgi:predicted ATPase